MTLQNMYADSPYNIQKASYELLGHIHGGDRSYRFRIQSVKHELFINIGVLIELVLSVKKIIRCF